MTITTRNISGAREERWLGNGFGTARATHEVVEDGQVIGRIVPCVGGYHLTLRGVDRGRFPTFAAARRAAKSH